MRATPARRGDSAFTTLRHALKRYVWPPVTGKDLVHQPLRPSRASDSITQLPCPVGPPRGSCRKAGRNSSRGVPVLQSVNEFVAAAKEFAASQVIPARINASRFMLSCKQTTPGAAEGVQERVIVEFADQIWLNFVQLYPVINARTNGVITCR